MIKQKIIFLMPSMKIGGGNRALLSLANKFSESGHSCSIYFIDINERSFPIPKNVFTKSIQIYNPNLLNRLLAMLRLSILLNREDKGNILIVSDPILCIFKFIFRHLKVIRFVQGDDKRLFDENVKANYIVKKIYRLLFKISQLYRYENIFFNSKFSRRVYCQNFKFLNEEKFEVIHPPLFDHQLKVQNREPSYSFVSVTSNQSRKGLDLLIEIAKSDFFSDYSFTAISQDDLILPKNIKLIKPKNDQEYFSILNKHSFFISTSTFEGFGLPPLEAMSLGLVVLAYKNEGILTYCNDQNTFFYNLNSLENLRKSVDLLVTNNDKYNLYSKKSIDTSKDFLESKYQDNFYNSIIGKGTN